jgi:putative nucleotidyltransferase with HDIG domain
MRDYLHDVLSQDGYHCKCFSDGFELFSYLGEEGGQGDLVLTDISMPGLSGIELLRAAHTVEPDLPVILISGMYELALALDALNAGAADYLLKPALPRDVLGLVKKHLQPVDDSQQSIAREELRRHLNKHQGGQGVADFLQDLHEALEFKRYETLQHCKRVAAYSDLIGRACGLGESELSDLQTGSLLHDIGKVAIPRNVLVKPGSLNDEERTAMCLHPQIGWEMLSEYPELQPAAEIVYTHHERFDGKGYPRGLRAAAIPLGARIFSIVDAFDAITSNRPYRAAQPIEQARAEIEKRSGTQFDPEFVGVFLQLPRKELQVIHERYQDGTDGLGT